VNAEVKALIPLMPWLHGREVLVRPLEGGLTNRNYCICCGSDRFVLRIMGENSGLLGIDRRTEHACAQAAWAAGIGPGVMAFFPDQGALVTRFVTGQALVCEAIKTPAILRRVVASLRRYHECSNGAGKFSAFETVRRYYAEARKRKVPFPRSVVLALEMLARIEDQAGAPECVCPCHNDLLPGNLVDDGRRVWILDWEYGGAGDLFFDLGNLAANSLFDRERETTLLQLYFGKARPPDLRRLRLMRLASDMREAMWGFMQMGVSKLDFDYRTYARRHLQRFLEGAGRAPGLAGRALKILAFVALVCRGGC
jgi:thiamine kinase-like enzyme